MADNVAITAGTGTTIGADDVGGVLIQRVKTTWGPDGTANDADVATGKPLPVQLRGSDGTDRSNLLPVSVSSIAAGNNNIGDVDIASIAAGTNNIGDVDVLTVPTDPFGANADAASLTTSISAKLKGIATALGITALDLGSGTGGSRTLRWFHDTAQWIGGAGAVTAATQRTTLASDDPAVTVLGAQADAASATTSIKAALRALATAFGTTALDLGSGTGGTRTLRMIPDSTAVITKGTAGSAASDVITVQGIASMTPLLATVTNVPLTNFGAGEYETVAASQTAQALGATGATGDYCNGLLVIPATTSPGLVTLLDNATSIPVFVGGASSVSNLVPFFIPIGLISTSGAWKVTTGANVSVLASGNFT